MLPDERPPVLPPPEGRGALLLGADLGALLLGVERGASFEGALCRSCITWGAILMGELPYPDRPWLFPGAASGLPPD